MKGLIGTWCISDNDGSFFRFDGTCLAYTIDELGTSGTSAKLADCQDTCKAEPDCVGVSYSYEGCSIHNDEVCAKPAERTDGSFGGWYYHSGKRKK